MLFARLCVQAIKPCVIYFAHSPTADDLFQGDLADARVLLVIESDL
jgi:hypothetical protein